MTTYNGDYRDETINVIGAGYHQVNAGEGHNTVLANDPNSTVNVNAGSGNDNITTNSGNDIINAGEGQNTINAGNGNNAVNTGSGRDIITTGTGDDQINAGEGSNIINAGNGNNAVNTGNGFDVVSAGSGNDIISSGGGDSYIYAGDGNNVVNAGSGNDVVSAGSGNDVINVGDGYNVVNAGGGNNVINAGNSSDVINTYDGDDQINAGEGSNTIWAGNGNNTINAGSGNDIVTVGSGNDFINVGEGNNVVVAGDGFNQIYAGSGNDIIIASTGIEPDFGIDRVYAGGGNDYISMGGGSDIVYAGDGNDTVVHVVSQNIGSTDDYWAEGGSDTLQLVLTAEQAKNSAILADIAGFQASMAKGEWMYEFKSIGLTARQFEKLEVYAPVEANNDSATVGEDDAPITINVLANDKDLLAASNGKLKVTDFIVQGGVPEGAEVTLKPDGTFSFNPGTAYQYLNGNETATLTFTYTIKDDQGFTDTATTTITVTGKNDLASISGTKTGTVTEDGEPQTGGGKLTVSDADQGQAQFQPINSADLDTQYGAFTFDGDGNWTFVLDNAAAQTLGAGQTIQQTLTVKSADGTAQETVTVDVVGAAEPQSNVTIYDSGSGVYSGNNPMAQGSYVAQDFVLSSDSIIDSFTFNALTTAATQPVQDVNIRIYEKSGSSFGDLVYASNLDIMSSQDTGTWGGYTLEDFTVMLPSLELDAGQYFLALNVTPVQWDMHWTIPTNATNPGNDLISYNGGSTWSSYMWDHDFRFTGSVVPII